MKVLTDDKQARRDKRKRSISLLANTALLLMLLFSVLLMVVARYLPQFTNSPFLLIAMGILSSGVGLISGRMLSTTSSSIDEIELALKGFGDDALLLNHIGPSQHLLISSYGIFTINVLSQPADILADGSTLRIHNRLFTRFLWIFTGNPIGRPYDDSLEMAQRSTEWIQNETDITQTFDIQPLILLIHPKAHVESHDPLVPVLYSDKRTPNLKQFVRRCSSNLPSHNLIDQLISSYPSLTQTND